MPTPGQMATGQQSTIPRELLEQMPQQRGAMMGAGHAMTHSPTVHSRAVAGGVASLHRVRINMTTAPAGSPASRPGG